MTQQQMDQMNDSLQDQMLAAYYKQQERMYDEMVNEESPYNEELEMQERIEASPTHYLSNAN